MKRKVKDINKLIIYKDIKIKDIESIINNVEMESDYFIKLNGYLICLEWTDKNIYTVTRIEYLNPNYKNYTDGIIA